MGELEDAYAACARMARQHYENFPVASWLLPRDMRPHVLAVYAFARTADDFADEGDRTTAERLGLLDAWQRELDAAVAGRSVGARTGQRTPGLPSETGLIFTADQIWLEQRYDYFTAALTISMKSGFFRLAPPTRAPSISG